MRTYLFAWNPQKWEWADIEEDINKLRKTGLLIEKWSCVSHKQVRIGDRAFLSKVGSDPRGIFASGYVVSEPFVSPHWDGSDRTVHDVLVEIDSIVNPYTQSILEVEKLHPEERWTPQSSGISISKEAAEDLERKWFDFLSHQGFSTESHLKDSTKTSVFTEGTSREVVQTFRERNPFARKVCLEHYGYKCHVCCFDFEKQYGAIGKEFIHVHHLSMVSSKTGEYELNPVEDLRPVCPNCHAMIHKRNPPYSIEEMKDLISTSFCQ